MMDTLWKSMLLVICGCHLASPAVDDCPYKECQCYGTDIDCQGLELTSVPILYSTGVTSYLTLTLDSNHITEISAGSLPIGLTELSLNDNPITTIDDNAFDELSTTLETLYFSNARLVRIPDAFLRLNSLQHLNIISTKVVDWNIGAMAHVGPTLQNLNIEEVGFTTWPVWMKYCTNLNELSLEGNAISSIPDDAFDSQSSSLQYLTLTNNSLTASPKSLLNLKNLNSLDLDFNNISNVTWLPQSSKLSSLGLNINHISDTDHLREVLRPFASSLQAVILSYNHMTAIPDLSFLINVVTYDLSNNLISDPSSGSMHNTTSWVDLSFNLLPSIPTIYRHLKLVTIMLMSHNIIHAVQAADIPLWATSLDLQFNLISELNDASFPVNCSLQSLTLDNNPLVKVSNLALKNLGHVIYLSLRNTKLSRLPLSLAYLTSVSDLDLSNNRALVCTCLEKSLKERITLNINSNHITEISAASLPIGLTELSLNDNPITTIDDNAFDELSTTLETVYFSNARLLRIPDAFLRLNSLHNLNIFRTKVVDWNIGAMAHIGQTLQTLNIEEVGFTTWPVWMKYCTNLNQLSLASNAISSIPDDAFDSQSNSLQFLTLTNNSLNASPKSLSNLKNLISLDLDFNKISNVTWLPQSSKLYSLGLNFNHISDIDQISEALRPLARSLDSLIIIDNHMTAIPDFSFLIKVVNFDLSNNLISDPSSGSMHNATSWVDLSFNLLPSIPTIYRDLKLVTIMLMSHNLIRAVQAADIPLWATSLDLQFNLISELNDESFPVNCSLQSLTLDNNPLVKVSNFAFESLGSLNSLSLQHTKLTRLPLSLAFLNSVSDLDLSNNRALVCTCLEKSLKERITSNINVSGDCGNISIYNFFALLSSSCPYRS